MKKTNLERRREAQRQADHWKRCAQRQWEQLAALKEDLEGWKQLVEAGNALLAGALLAAGADADHPVQLERETINAAVRGEITPQVSLTEGGGYQLHSRR